MSVAGSPADVLGDASGGIGRSVRICVRAMSTVRRHATPLGFLVSAATGLALITAYFVGCAFGAWAFEAQVLSAAVVVAIASGLFVEHRLEGPSPESTLRSGGRARS